MNNITVIACWWTIDKTYEWKSKNIYDFHIWEPVVPEIIRGHELNIEVQVIELFKKDSMDMDDNDRELIRITLENLKNDRVIITHGTDTMIETVKTVWKVQNKVVVFVWASTPHSLKNSNSEINLWYALGVLSILADLKQYWIYITMNWEYFNAFDVEKWNDGVFRKISL